MDNMKVFKMGVSTKLQTPDCKAKKSLMMKEEPSAHLCSPAKTPKASDKNSAAAAAPASGRLTSCLSSSSSSVVIKGSWQQLLPTKMEKRKRFHEKISPLATLFGTPWLHWGPKHSASDISRSVFFGMQQHVMCHGPL